MSAPILLELPPEQVEQIARRASELVEPAAEPEPWLDKRQLAGALSMSVRWVETRLRDDPPMPSVMLNGRRRFQRSEVEAWLETAGHLQRSV